jgi:hypothetical protein
VENVEKFLALNKELSSQRKEILDETIAKLRQELGEDFKKLDDYIYKKALLEWPRRLRSVAQMSQTHNNLEVVPIRPRSRNHDQEKSLALDRGLHASDWSAQSCGRTRVDGPRDGGDGPCMDDLHTESHRGRL